MAGLVILAGEGKMFTEAIANQAVCPQCETYGRFGLVEDDPRRQQLKVRCRKCEHEWPIYD